jgi:hypothetical protein
LGGQKNHNLEIQKKDNELILEEQYLLRTVTKIYELDSIYDIKSAHVGKGLYELILYLKPDIKIRFNLDGVNQLKIQSVMSLLKTFLGWNK